MRSAIRSLMLIVLSSTACYSMRPVAFADLPAVGPGQVWVTRADQTVVMVAGPQIVNNRLVGFVDGVYRVIPAGDVQRVQMRTPAPARTAALVTAGAAAAVTLVVMVSSSGTAVDPCSMQSSECEGGIP